ncbi:hypothetical protein LSUE1_G000153 [Lachnellula suecica]|uniref:SGNH hydrolase-type esterase domain-containing protein n=1 Tax=Lachnellula suecica TaxID=602035 RepID=A0A8T9CK12_9HELO|nr:hypothetical protein LSUE1_G000153 [Lachnellula suecica]
MFDQSTYFPDEETHPATPYTHAILLGGTNDLAQGRSAHEIYKALRAVWTIPLSHSTSVLALTVPECPGCGPIPPSRRDKLNAAIMKHDGGNSHAIDLAARIPFENMTEEERRDIWDDGVHFTEKGYDLMGSVIAERLSEIISAEREGGVEGASASQKAGFEDQGAKENESPGQENQAEDVTEGRRLRSRKVSQAGA